MNNLNFEQFKVWLQENIKTYLPKEYADAEIMFRNMEKLGQSYTGMIVHVEGEKISPVLDTDQFYAAYQKGVAPEQFLADMATQIKRREILEDMEWLSDYSAVREHLFIRVSNAEKNAGILRNVPHKTMEDLALTYHVEVALAGEDMASVMINDTMLSEYGISAEQLHEDALNNSQAVLPATLDSMWNILAEMLPPEFQSNLTPPEGMDGDLLVLTNTARIHGAATLFYPGIMDEIAKEVQGDYFVLPSSIHEALILPATNMMDYRELEVMVQQVNAAEVDPKEQLSDRVYHYSAKEHRFERADHYEERLKEEQKKAIQKPEQKKHIRRNRL